MTITRLKSKNQLTLPASIIKRMGIRADELFAVDIDANCIRLMPVDLEPRYTPDELSAIDRSIDSEKPKGKVFRDAKSLGAHLRKAVRS